MTKEIDLVKLVDDDGNSEYVYSYNQPAAGAGAAQESCESYISAPPEYTAKAEGEGAAQGSCESYISAPPKYTVKEFSPSPTPYAPPTAPPASSPTSFPPPLPTLPIRQAQALPRTEVGTERSFVLQCIFAWCVCLFLNWIFGVIAIGFAWYARDAEVQGDKPRATSYGIVSVILSAIGMVTGVIAIILYFTLFYDK